VHADIGIRPQGVLVSSLIGLPSARYGSLDARAAFSRRLFASVKSLPGVDEAALAVSYPLSDLLMQFSIGIAGRTFPPNEQPAAMSDIVTPQYFDAMGIPLVRGRAFTPNDNAAARPVAIVNQTFGRMYARGGDAIGMRIVVPGFNGSTSATRTVVGIAGDTRTSLADAAKPQVYVPMEQSPTNLLSIVVRSRLPAAQLTNAVDKALAQMEPLLSPPAMQTYGDIVAEHSQQPRSMATLLTVLALLALLLALSGIFGVVSYNVMQRHAEFGLRAALGARQRDLLIDVVARVLGVTAIGILAGVTLAALGAQAVRPQLYATSPLDPATFSIVVVLIAGCAIAAALAPAVRAMRVDPAQALRYE
jgi:putative ABC transport system permease protein